MHKIKNKKIIPIILIGLVAITATSSYIYANDLGIKELLTLNEDTEDENAEDEENIEVLEIPLSEVSNIDNIGKKVKVSGTVENIENNIILIKDDSGKAGLFLNDIEIENVYQGDMITVIGVIDTIDNTQYVVVCNNLDVSIEKTEEGSDIEDDSAEEDNEKEDEDIEKPSINSNKPGQSGGLVQNNHSENTQNVQSNSSSASVKKIYARSYTIISTDLTNSQWEKVKTALENGHIKVVDLPDNKIRIKQVSNGYGDKVWIVNDPRNLDKEVEERIKKIGIDSLKSMSYNDYDITESKWNNIIEDVENGDAKVKLEDDTLKVIYNKANKLDTILKIGKKII